MAGPDKTPLSYQDAGVDIERGNAFVDRIKPAVKATNRPGVTGSLGGFGGLFALAECGYRDPLLVSATDGVGTKLRLAIDANKHDTVGIDLVAMCVNDVIVQGAEPLFFLDYFATAKLDTAVAAAVVEGIAAGCQLAGAALIGGETAEMPDMYATGDYDLAGFCVGAVERDKLIDGTRINNGDVLIGLPSSGVHSNGFSLVRRILDNEQNASSIDLDGTPLIEALLTPTRIYVKAILDLLKICEVKGIAHITGGGITDNLPRVIPEGLDAIIDLDSWPLSPLFRWLMRSGPIEEPEMLRTFNCGIGLILVVDADNADQVMTTLKSFGEPAFRIGQIRPGSRQVVYRGDLDGSN